MRTTTKHCHRAFAAQGERCHYCASPMWLRNKRAFAKAHGIIARYLRLFRATAEHVVPRQSGGTTSASNIVAACWHCNSNRHRGGRNPSADDYRRSVQRKCERGQYPTYVLRRTNMVMARPPASSPPAP